jgi:hypothetical protein
MLTVTIFFATVCSPSAFGKISFITEGFTIVEIIRKNNKSINMMSFSDEVLTSELIRLFLLSNLIIV